MINLLFLCTGNSCRSQMAEGWTRALKSDCIQAFSAGIQTHGLNPNAVKVMAEAGVDISGQKSQHIDEFKDTRLDVIVTVCHHAHETCPWFPAECKVLHVGFEDPPRMARELAAQGASEEAQLDAYRRVRDQIRDYVMTLPAALDDVVQIYDPPMCCSSGVCGPRLDPVLARFSGLVKDLSKRAGIRVERHNLGQNPEAFATNENVKALLAAGDAHPLPYVFVNGELFCEGRYPLRDEVFAALRLTPSAATPSGSESCG